MATEAPLTRGEGGFVSSQENRNPDRGIWAMAVALSGWGEKEGALPP